VLWVLPYAKLGGFTVLQQKIISCADPTYTTLDLRKKEIDVSKEKNANILLKVMPTLHSSNFLKASFYQPSLLA